MTGLLAEVFAGIGSFPTPTTNDQEKTDPRTLKAPLSSPVDIAME